MNLTVPNIDALPGYTQALQRGWSPNSTRPETTHEHLGKIQADPVRFVGSLDDPLALGGPIPLPDGTFAPRLPSLTRWIWDNGYCGTISLRWQPGTEDLPPTCLGHIGYAIVPWRRGQGLASGALRLLLPMAAAQGLRHVALSTRPDNAASIRVIQKAGGVLHKRAVLAAVHGAGEAFEFRIPLTNAAQDQ